MPHCDALRLLATLTTLTALVAAVPSTAAAQPQPRLSIAVNGGYQASSTSFEDRFTFDLNRETATARTSYPVDAGPLFDAGVSLRVWKGLGIGAALSRFNADQTVEVSASLPHPLFFQRNREISGEPGGLTRSETVVHIQAQYQLPPLGPLLVVVSGGPSLLDIKQSIVTGVNFTDAFPYDTATFVGVDSRRVSKTVTGFNVGADLRYMFTRHLGVGGLIRITRATADLSLDGRTIEVDAGGTQVGAGVRIAF